MARQVLVVGQAAGSEEVSGEVLGRFGFSKILRAESLSQAIDQLRQSHVDLLIIPLEHTDELQLATLEREIRREHFTNVIGTAPKLDPEIMLRAMRAGIQEFLVSPPDAKDLAGAVERLMRRTRTETENGQVVAVFSTKGGLGTSTVAVNLAYAFARNHREARLAIADLVIGAGDVRVLLNLSPSYDLGDLVAKLDRVDSELLNSLLTPASGGVWVLPAPESPEADEQVDAATTSTIIQHLRANFRFTVLDCEHHLSERTLAALDAADRVVLLTHLSVSALRSTQRTLQLARRLGYPNEKLCVVANRFQSGEVLSVADAADVLKTEIFFKLPNDWRVAHGALTKGVPIAEFDPSSKLAWAYLQLAAKLGGGAATLERTTPTGQNGAGSRIKQLFGRKRS
jgi:pilus assembly protein CpaE